MRFIGEKDVEAFNTAYGTLYDLADYNSFQNFAKQYQLNARECVFYHQHCHMCGCQVVDCFKTTFCCTSCGERMKGAETCFFTRNGIPDCKLCAKKK